MAPAFGLSRDDGSIVILKCGGRLDPETAARLRDAWIAAHTGSGSERVLLLDDSFDVVVIPPDRAAANRAYSARFGDCA